MTTPDVLRYAGFDVVVKQCSYLEIYESLFPWEGPNDGPVIAAAGL